MSLIMPLQRDKIASTSVIGLGARRGAASVTSLSLGGQSLRNDGAVVDGGEMLQVQRGAADAVNTETLLQRIADAHGRNKL